MKPKLAALLIFGLACARPGGAATNRPDRERKIEALLSGVTSPDSPGLAVLVRKQGRAVFERGYGLRDLRSKARIDSHTNFRLASFTKQFTAMAVLLLVEDGKLGFEQTLTELFPDFPDYGRSITVRSLLNHTSGLADYEELMEARERSEGPVWSAEHQIQDAEVLALLEREKAGKFKPGTSWSYSNSGYVVLGLIVAKVSGRSYGEFLQQRIFSPLGMKQTLAFQKGKNEVVNRAYGHTRENQLLRENDQSPTSATLGDGGIYSNLADLALWDQALDQQTLLTGEEFEPALREARLIGGGQPRWPDQPGGDNLFPGRPVAYGFGWFLDPYKNHRRFWHNGSTVGFGTVIERFPGDHLSILILSNRSDLDPASLAQKIADLELDLP